MLVLPWVCYTGMAVVLLGVGLVSHVGVGGSDEHAYCQSQPDGSLHCEEEATDIHLVRLSTGEVGDMQELSGVIPGQTLQMTTLSTKPLAFEIPGFLSDEECDYFTDVAKKQGLMASQTMRNPGGTQGHNIHLMDLDQDKRLSVDEMILTLEDSFDLYLTDGDIVDMYADLKMDVNEDTFITPQELSKFSTATLRNYLLKFSNSYPEKRSRFSKQLWLFADSSSDDVFQGLQERVQRLTELPMLLIKKSDFQIVSYGPEGHYNAHHDSSPLDADHQCCSRSRQFHCRICRYVTVLFYLNDVEEGGGTAFPLAGNETYDENEFRKSHKINLQEHCAEANLVVPPARGKAVMWYNHFIDEETGWMGEMDVYSWHGGCPVIKGEKWIANFWIKTTDNKLEDLTEDVK